MIASKQFAIAMMALFTTIAAAGADQLYADEPIVVPDNRCGPFFQMAACPVEGTRCSQYGFCGSTAVHKLWSGRFVLHRNLTAPCTEVACERSNVCCNVLTGECEFELHPEEIDAQGLCTSLNVNQNVNISAATTLPPSTVPPAVPVATQTLVPPTTATPSVPLTTQTEAPPTTATPSVPLTTQTAAPPTTATPSVPLATQTAAPPPTTATPSVPLATPTTTTEASQVSGDDDNDDATPLDSLDGENPVDTDNTVIGGGDESSTAWLLEMSTAAVVGVGTFLYMLGVHI